MSLIYTNYVRLNHRYSFNQLLQHLISALLRFFGLALPFFNAL